MSASEVPRDVHKTNVSPQDALAGTTRACLLDAVLQKLRLEPEKAAAETAQITYHGRR